MRKVEMVQRMAQELGCTTAKAAAAVEAILAAVKAA
jgi:nucleoid DNA-binding protein